jgi:LPS-assembly protein
MRMFRHSTLFALATALAIGSNPVRSPAAEPLDADALPARCPDDAAARLPAQRLGPALTPDDSIEVLSDSVRGDRARNAEVRGRVEVRQGDKVVSADHVTFLAAENRINVQGGVEYRDPQLVVRGEGGSLANGEARFEGAQFELPLQPARGAAQSMTLDRAGNLRMEGVRYTTCPTGQQDWQIRARSVALDTNRSIGTARDARIEFFGVPIMRLPVISFPVGSARKSGLLFPGIGQSTSNGVQLGIPYYFNIAPNQDLTLTPTYYSRRGFDLESQYRLLTRSSRLELLANVLPNDRRANDTRTRLRLHDVTALAGDWRLSLDAETVSDPRYFEDFAQGADGASIAFLPRRLQLGYRSDHVDAGILLRNFQTLDQALPADERPLAELPRFYARGAWSMPGALPLNWGIDTEAVAFRRSGDLSGWRFDATPQVLVDWIGPGYFVKPAVALETTLYQLRNVAGGVDATPSRTLPIASLDTGLLFERGSGRRGQRRMTLEPRLMYLYTPYRNQSMLPVFDTAIPDLNWVELFRTNRYVGTDRISDANQLSAGVTTRLYSSRSGARFLATTIGQTYYFRSPRVRLPDETLPTGNQSDLIAQVELQAFKNWNVSLGMQWDNTESHTERSEARIRYQPEYRSVVNFGYRFQRDRLEQADFSAAWPISDKWRLYGRALYSLQDKQSIEHFAGFEYSSCCWSVRAVGRSYVSRRTGERDRSLYLQLELKGLSNVGLAADAFLEKAIRGYSANRRHR